MKRKLSPINAVRWLFDSRRGPRGRLVPRWILSARARPHLLLRVLFAALSDQGPDRPGRNPAGAAISGGNRRPAGASRGIGTRRRSTGFRPARRLLAVTWIGLLASVAPSAICGRASASSSASCASSRSSARPRVLELSIGRHAARSRISFAVLRAARPACRDGARTIRPSRASWFLLQWEWFRIYFESGMVKLASGDPQWRNLTAMDEYYQNGPLPTWIGWYVRAFPHWFHAAGSRNAGAGTGLVFMMFFPAARALDLLFHRHAVGDRRDSHRQLHVSELPGAVARDFCLLDDKFLLRFVPARFRPHRACAGAALLEPEHEDERPMSIFLAARQRGQHRAYEERACAREGAAGGRGRAGSHSTGGLARCR
jgi:hypothetical protein